MILPLLIDSLSVIRIDSQLLNAHASTAIYFRKHYLITSTSRFLVVVLAVGVGTCVVSLAFDAN
jgi:hypothetical protein